jgi:hypothetical protein
LGGASAGAVPEPSSFSIVVVLILAAGGELWRRGRALHFLMY